MEKLKVKANLYWFHRTTLPYFDREGLQYPRVELHTYAETNGENDNLIEQLEDKGSILSRALSDQGIEASLFYRRSNIPLRGKYETVTSIFFHDIANPMPTYEQWEMKNYPKDTV